MDAPNAGLGLVFFILGPGAFVYFHREITKKRHISERLQEGKGKFFKDCLTEILNASVLRARLLHSTGAVAEIPYPEVEATEKSMVKKAVEFVKMESALKKIISTLTLCKVTSGLIIVNGLMVVTMGLIAKRVGEPKLLSALNFLSFWPVVGVLLVALVSFVTYLVYDHIFEKKVICELETA